MYSCLLQNSGRTFRSSLFLCGFRWLRGTSGLQPNDQTAIGLQLRRILPFFVPLPHRRLLRGFGCGGHDLRIIQRDDVKSFIRIGCTYSDLQRVGIPNLGYDRDPFS
jgi:hypothetical protein